MKLTQGTTRTTWGKLDNKEKKDGHEYSAPTNLAWYPHCFCWHRNTLKVQQIPFTVSARYTIMVFPLMFGALHTLTMITEQYAALNIHTYQQQKTNISWGGGVCVCVLGVGGGGGGQKAVTKLLLDKHSKTICIQCKSLDKITGLLFKSEQKWMDESYTPG